MKILKLTAIAGLAWAGSAHALEFEAFGTNITLLNNVSAGAAIRLEDPDPALYAITNTNSKGEAGTLFSNNSDDGNLSFEKGDLISSAFKITSRLEAGWKNFGVSIRGSGLYDPTLYDKDFFDEADYLGPPTRTATADDLARKREEVQSHVGLDADLLEAFISADFDIAGRFLSLRLGKQVINWGETTFIQHGLNSLLSFDTSQLRVPGWEIEEVYIPSNMIWGSFEISQNLSISAFYQLEWNETLIDPAGTFFSTNDFVGRGGLSAEVGLGQCEEFEAPGQCPFAPGGTSIPRAADRLASDQDQGGVSLSYFLEAFGGTEVSVYAANMHSRLPMISGTAALAGFEGVAGAANFFIEYPEDIKLYGLSFNTQLPFGGIALQGEYSLKQDQPLTLDEIEALVAGLRTPLPSQIGPFAPGEYLQGWRRHDVSQFVLSGSKIIGPVDWMGTDQTVLLLEAGATQVHSFPDTDELRYEGPNTVRPGDPLVAAALGAPVQDGGYPDAFSWGYRALARFSFNNVLNRYNINPTVVFSHDVSGTAPLPVSNFVEDRKQLVFRIDTVYQNVWNLRLAYTNFFGAGEFNQLADRDNLALSMSYTF